MEWLGNRKESAKRARQFAFGISSRKAGDQRFDLKIGPSFTTSLESFVSRPIFFCFHSFLSFD